MTFFIFFETGSRIPGGGCPYSSGSPSLGSAHLNSGSGSIDSMIRSSSRRVGDFG